MNHSAEFIADEIDNTQAAPALDAFQEIDIQGDLDTVPIFL
jgi:hypothetical protein